MEDWVELVGLNEQGAFCILRDGQYKVAEFNLFYTMKGISLGEQGLLYKIGHKFFYHNGAYFCQDQNEVLKQIYENESGDCFNRVPISKTGYKNYPDFENSFISANAFSSKVLALTLGLCEAAIRSSWPPYLVSKIPVLSAHQVRVTNKSRFNIIFDSFKDTKSLKDTIKILGRYEISNLQEFCNCFSVGVILHYFDSNNLLIKDFRLPEKPEISPIPLIKILYYSNIYSLLYDQAENFNDGYNEDGLLLESYQHEEIPSSFYMFKSESFHEKIATQLLKMFSLYIDPQVSNKGSVENFGNELLSELSKMAGNLAKSEEAKLKHYIDELERIQSKLKASQPNNPTQLIQKGTTGLPKTYSYMPNNYGIQSPAISGRPNGTQMNNISDPVIEGPDNYKLQTPQSYNLANDKPPIQNIKIANNPPPSNISYAHETQIYHPNSAPEIPTTLTNSTHNARLVQKICLGCNVKKETNPLHGACNLCMYCIALSLQEIECMGCAKKDIREDIKQYRNNGLKCSGCGTLKKDYKLNNICKCIICRNCENSMKFENHRFHLHF